ncbi:MAG: hypothetical protein COY58_06915 [Gammaproteobacteria bacterium CG_4_10_14_0_8_um_filter_38_16]|nr:MAG: hypothetical protein COY58_06915 [Gammaproteobacteria bacterium CG_4_10_14_0_8_um_filter_38_16]PJA04193.1 MAG: hypothetical protein COX72_01060 [Gammaproteobacteria bacterium CG_4_10_14_0_2_um_filter_38_22]
MRNLLFIGLLSILWMPHFSYAADNTQSQHVSVQRQASARSHSKIHHVTPVDMNHANATQLTSLKGIGVKKANAILAFRQTHGVFKNVDQLANVKGIGKKGLLRLQTNNPGRIQLN